MEIRGMVAEPGRNYHDRLSRQIQDGKPSASSPIALAICDFVVDREDL
jgi:hypothetical protein